MNDILEAKSQLKEIENKVEKNNWATYIDKKGNKKDILWVKGIKAPKMGKDGDFTSPNFPGFEEYQAPYIQGRGWYDTNKTGGDGDSKLCFAGVATNMIYWWIDQNKEEIKSYIYYLNEKGHFNNQDVNFRDIRELINENRPQQSNKIYSLLTRDFGYRTRGFQTDLLIDYFINGFTPKSYGDINRPEDMITEEKKDRRAGFFYDVFKNQVITDRISIPFRDDAHKIFSNEVRKILEGGKIAGVVDTANGYTAHIFTLWGAEFDENGFVNVIYITDTDDQDQERKLGMSRYMVRKDGPRVRLSNDINNLKAGPYVYSLQTLDTGKTQWKEFLKKINK